MNQREINSNQLDQMEMMMDNSIVLLMFVLEMMDPFLLLIVTITEFKYLIINSNSLSNLEVMDIKMDNSHIHAQLL